MRVEQKQKLTRDRESMASEDHDVNEGVLAVQRLLQRRNAEKEAGAILERIARDMSTSEVSGMPTSASTPVATSQDFGDTSSTPRGDNHE